MHDYAIDDNSSMTLDYELEEPTLPHYAMQDAEIAIDTKEQIHSLAAPQGVLAHYSHPDDRIAARDGSDDVQSNCAEGAVIDADADDAHLTAPSIQHEEMATATKVTLAEEIAPESMPSLSGTESAPSICRPERFTSPAFPHIQVKPGQLHEALAAAELVLAQTGNYYQRGGRVVCIRVDPLTKASHVQEMDGQGLMVTLAGLSTWSRYDKRTGGWTAIDPCPRICKLLAESWQYSRLNVLNGAVHQPHLRSDGSICATPGYDPNTGLLGTFDAGVLNVSDQPTRDDAIKALNLLSELLDECAFAAPEDRSAALSALLTAAVRPSLPHAPMFHVMAHQPGSGKSFLCQLITALATAAPSTPVAFPRSNDACDKLLLAQLMRSPAVIEFDNVTDDLRPFEKLCSALTSEWLEGRQLGVSRTVVVGT